MKIKCLLLFTITLILISCNKGKQEINNPFATPEGCVKEYLDATDSCDVARMLKCYSYEPKYERIIKEGLQQSLDKSAKEKDLHPGEYHQKVDSVKLTELYPNSAVVRVFLTYGYNPEDNTSTHYDCNLVKDSTNWKLEAQLSYTITTN